MTNNDVKQLELVKYRDLVLAVLEYSLEYGMFSADIPNLNKHEYVTGLKEQTHENFKKGRLTRLKQWFKDLSEPYIEQLDFNYNDYLNQRTTYEMDVFRDYFNRVDKVIAKGKITTDNQFYDLKNAADLAVQSNLFDIKKTEQLNKLLFDYENKKQSRTKKPI